MSIPERALPGSRIVKTVPPLPELHHFLDNDPQQDPRQVSLSALNLESEMPSRQQNHYAAGNTQVTQAPRSQYLEDLRASPGGLSGRWVPKDVPLDQTSSKPRPRGDRKARGAYVIYGSGCNSCGELGLSISSVKFTTFPSFVPWPGQLSCVAAAGAGCIFRSKLQNKSIKSTLSLSAS